jgi:hypothetical protein
LQADLACIPARWAAARCAAVPTRGALRGLLLRPAFADQQGVEPISEAGARTPARPAEEF